MFKFELNQEVAIVASGEAGVVIGRAEYVHAERGYLIRYRAADGRASESWWTESALVAAADVVAVAPDPAAGGEVDRTVAAPIQNVGDGTD